MSTITAEDVSAAFDKAKTLADRAEHARLHSTPAEATERVAQARAAANYAYRLREHMEAGLGAPDAPDLPALDERPAPPVGATDVGFVSIGADGTISLTATDPRTGHTVSYPLSGPHH